MRMKEIKGAVMEVLILEVPPTSAAARSCRYRPPHGRTQRSDDALVLLRNLDGK